MEETTLSKIIELEWDMFTAVNNTGGKAWCQEDPRTFRVMRLSQEKTWPEELRQSYYEDLLMASLSGRNLMAEKYARTMVSTYPEEYAKIASSLPEVDGETLELIEKIVATHVEWEREVARMYPRLSAWGRPVETKGDSQFGTSFET